MTKYFYNDIDRLNSWLEDHNTPELSAAEMDTLMGGAPRVHRQTNEINITIEYGTDPTNRLRRAFKIIFN